MSEVKKAVIVGKIELKPRREVVVGPKADAGRQPQFVAKKPETQRPRGLKRADDGRAAVGANQAMLQELNYVKTQLRTAKEQATAANTAASLLAADVKRLLGLLGGDITQTDEYQAVAKAVGFQG